jgi:hypothetical protein
MSDVGDSQQNLGVRKSSVIERSRYRGIELVAETGSPLAFLSVADTLGINTPMQSDKW